MGSIKKKLFPNPANHHRNKENKFVLQLLLKTLYLFNHCSWRWLECENEKRENSFLWFIFFWWFIDILKQLLQTKEEGRKPLNCRKLQMSYLSDDALRRQNQPTSKRFNESKNYAKWSCPKHDQRKMKFRRTTCMFQLNLNFLSSRKSSDEKSSPHFLICFSTINSKRYDREAWSYGHFGSRDL